jgi:hypothetical protein
MNRPGPGMRTVKMDFQYQPLIPEPPAKPQQLYSNATSGDTVTIETWRQTWIDNYKANKERFGELATLSMGKLYGAERHRPAIILGAGPSLKYSLDALRENQTLAKPIPTVSCLHNLAYLKNEGIKVDYYVSLDAGEVVLDDAIEGQEKKDYWSQTAGDVLVANVTSNPKLFDHWKGKVHLYNCLVPDDKYREETDKVEVFRHYLSSGGNVGGACMYFAKAVLGCNPIVFTGIDFCFDYANEFHSYPTKYDNWEGKGLGHYITHPDVFGNMRKTYPSYFNFKCWIDYISMQVPGSWVYCGEGIVGAYREGNIAQFQYMTLQQFITQYKMSELVIYQTKNGDGTMHEKLLNMGDVWADPKYDQNVVLF